MYTQNFILFTDTPNSTTLNYDKISYRKSCSLKVTYIYKVDIFYSLYQKMLGYEKCHAIYSNIHVQSGVFSSLSGLWKMPVILLWHSQTKQHIQFSILKINARLRMMLVILQWHLCTKWTYSVLFIIKSGLRKMPVALKWCAKRVYLAF